MSEKPKKKIIDTHTQLVRELSCHLNCDKESIEKGLKSHAAINIYIKNLESDIKSYQNDWKHKDYVETQSNLIKQLKQLKQTIPPRSLEDALDSYCEAEGLPKQCIEELLHLDTLRPEQRGWLECALVWWDVQCANG